MKITKTRITIEKLREEFAFRSRRSGDDDVNGSRAAARSKTVELREQHTDATDVSSITEAFSFDQAEVPNSGAEDQ